MIAFLHTKKHRPPLPLTSDASHFTYQKPRTII